MSENVRNILLRALFEPDFHNKLQTNAEDALGSYELSEEERRALLSPSAELYGFLAPRASPTASLSRRLYVEPPTTTTTTTTTVVSTVIAVAIVVFVTAIAASNPQQSNLEPLQPLITAIKNAQGAERMNLITTLVSELTREV